MNSVESLSLKYMSKWTQDNTKKIDLFKLLILIMNLITIFPQGSNIPLPYKGSSNGTGRLKLRSEHQTERW